MLLTAAVRHTSAGPPTAATCKMRCDRELRPYVNAYTTGARSYEEEPEAMSLPFATSSSTSTSSTSASRRRLPSLGRSPSQRTARDSLQERESAQLVRVATKSRNLASLTARLRCPFLVRRPTSRRYASSAAWRLCERADQTVRPSAPFCAFSRE